MGFFRKLTDAAKSLFGRGRAKSKGDGGRPVPRGGTATFYPMNEIGTAPLGEDDSLTPRFDVEPYPEGGDEARLFAGDTLHVSSSNVDSISYDQHQHILYVRYKDGSLYAYEQVSHEEALSMLHAGSHGKWVWDHLRVRGTVFGWQKPYTLVGNHDVRAWYAAGAKSIARWEAIGPAGPDDPGFHPAGTDEEPRAQGWRDPKTRNSHVKDAIFTPVSEANQKGGLGRKGKRRK